MAKKCRIRKLPKTEFVGFVPKTKGYGKDVMIGCFKDKRKACNFMKKHKAKGMKAIDYSKTKGFRKELDCKIGVYVPISYYE